MNKKNKLVSNLRFLVLFVVVVTISSSLVSAFTVTFDKIYGTPDHKEEAYSVTQTFDAAGQPTGYVLVGRQDRFFGSGSYDGRIIRTDVNGNELWNKTYTALFSRKYEAYHVQQTTDGGFIIAGYTSDIIGAGSRDFWLVKLDADGNEIWSKAFGGVSYEEAYSVQQTSDGGYVIAGIMDSFVVGSWDFWLVKTNSSGDTCDYSGDGECFESPEKFVKKFGGNRWDRAFSVEQTTDGGYIVAGDTETYGAGGFDFLLIKTDENGDAVWNNTFGGTGNEFFSWQREVHQTSDGGYVLVGGTGSFVNGPYDAWVVKTDENGDTCDYNAAGNCFESTEKFVRTFGGTSGDGAESIQQTSDGGYIIAGKTSSFGASGFENGWLIKTDSNGNVELNETFGEVYKHWFHSVQETFDEVGGQSTGYITTGFTINSQTDQKDFWLVKVEEGGVPPECENNADCDDGNSCTVNRCVAPDCVFLNCDLDSNHNIGLADIMRVISVWALNEGDPWFIEEYDIDGNGNIGLSDVMMVISLWANNC